ncbi:hypothetical protein ACQEVX_04830 [Streptomyces syringium]|uniref:hypothetical protein n=1 Tax=Streptomyces syringium TaxID=76729 RepID=UPI003D9237A1
MPLRKQRTANYLREARLGFRRYLIRSADWGRRGDVIDRQRIIALAQQPRDWEADDLAAGQRVRGLGLWHHETSPLARPIMWSEAACRDLPEERELPSRGQARRVCVLCPIEGDCRAALIVGAPDRVREWRELAEAA